jgi:signal transduction histidine kinase
MPGLLRTIHLILFLFYLAGASAQAKSDCLDVSQTRLVEFLDNYVSSLYYKTPLEKNRARQARYIIQNDSMQAGVQRGTVPAHRVMSTLYLRFELCNSADSAIDLYFFPGFYYEDIRLYRHRGDEFRQMEDFLPAHRDSIGFRRIRLEAQDSATILAELRFVRTYINTVRPRLVHPEYLPAFSANLGSRSVENDLMTYIFCGLLLMMILYSMANFIQGANPEFLYYSGYAFFLGAMLFTKAIFNFHSTRTSYFFESYLDFIMQGLGILLYMVFMQKFLETRTRYPFLYRFYNIGIALLGASLLSFSFFHFFSDLFVVENAIENFTKIFLLLMVLIFLLYSIRHRKDPLMRYLFWGNLCLFFFSLFSQFIIMNPVLRELPGIFGSSLFYYEVGLLLELVFFLIGLNQKNRRKIIDQARAREALKAQNKLLEYEKEIAVYKAQQAERERISADMHDELGSGMTVIRLMSEIARNKMKENTPVEIDRISASANDVLNKMNAIIWSMNSGNDSLDNLVSYIRSYALEFFDNTPVQCTVEIPPDLPAIEITGDKRRNIFLCVKEILHNVLKHAKATRVWIIVQVNSALLVHIHDNGVGMDANGNANGNGLKNIRNRMEGIGGTVTMENQDGLHTRLILPL